MAPIPPRIIDCTQSPDLLAGLPVAAQIRQSETANALIVGDPQAHATQLGPIANEAQFHRVQTMIQAGLDEGAKLLCGGPGREIGRASCRERVSIAV